VVRDLRLHHHDVQRVLGHLQLDVVAVVADARHLRERRRPHERLAVILLVLGHLHLDVLDRALPAQHLRRVHDRVDDLPVARAAADVAVLLKPIPHVFAAGALIFIQ